MNITGPYLVVRLRTDTRLCCIDGLARVESDMVLMGVMRMVPVWVHTVFADDAECVRIGWFSCCILLVGVQMMVGLAAESK